MNREIIPLSNINGRNDRFSYAKVQQDGECLFLKTALTPGLEPNLKREFLWADFLNYVALKEPDAHLRAPRMRGFDANGGLMMEYVDAPLVASPNDGVAWKAKVSRYATTLALLDKYAEDYEADWPQDSITNMNDPEAIWRRWFGKHLDDARPILQIALSVFDEGRDSLTYRVQHGDLTPWQMFELGDEWIIFDGEKAGNHLPRYNDLAYGYGRLFTRLKDPATASKLLEEFLEYSGIERKEFFKQFLPIMTLRATGMLADAYSDNVNEDYHEDALALLRLCFDKVLDNFLPTKSN